MTPRGFAAVGLVRPKDAANIGSVLRGAFCYGAASVAIASPRIKPSIVRGAATDTPKAWRHMPTIIGEDILTMCPVGAIPVAVDLVPGAVALPDFEHPERAFYVFGPEDGTLGRTITDRCAHRVMVPTRVCMNLAATVNVILYDRLAKQMQHAASLGVAA